MSTALVSYLLIINIINSKLICDRNYNNYCITTSGGEQSPLSGCSSSLTTLKACSTLAASVTSIWTAVKREEHASRTALAPSGVRHVAITWHPAASSRWAARWPKPESQPVMSTCRPAGLCRSQSQTRKNVAAMSIRASPTITIIQITKSNMVEVKTEDPRQSTPASACIHK